MIARSVLVLLPVLFVAACGGSADSAGGGSPCSPPPPPPAAEEGIVRRDTPKGEAAIELVIEPKTIGTGERITIRLVNRGTVELLTGLPFEVERWDGERWVRVPWPENTAFQMVGIVLRPGGSTDPQHWPTEGVQARPGCYRAVKSAGVWDLERIRDPKRAQGAEGAGGARLQAFARFSVRPGRLKPGRTA